MLNVVTFVAVVAIVAVVAVVASRGSPRPFRRRFSAQVEILASVRSAS